MQSNFQLKYFEPHVIFSELDGVSFMKDNFKHFIKCHEISKSLLQTGFFTSLHVICRQSNFQLKYFEPHVIFSDFFQIFSFFHH